MDGIIILDKPSGLKSIHCVNQIKWAMHVEKAGHCGTLDPNSTGVLPIVLGKAVKLSEVLSTSDKTYIGKMNLHEKVTKAKLLKAIKEKFTGTIKQLPPKISAVKRAVREREIHYFKILSLKDRIAEFEIKCQHGFYVRKGIHDLGDYLGVGAHMFELRRIQSGPFTIDEATPLEKVLKDPLKYVLNPIEGVRRLPKVYLDKEVIEPLKHGSPVFAPGATNNTKFEKGDTVALIFEDELVGIGKAELASSSLKKDTKGIAIKTDFVLI